MRRDWEKAMEFYNEALKSYESHAKAMLALAKIYMANGDTDACQEQCVTLLREYPDNEEASIMLAELMFHKVSIWPNQQHLTGPQAQALNSHDVRSLLGALRDGHLSLSAAFGTASKPLSCAEPVDFLVEAGRQTRGHP